MILWFILFLGFMLIFYYAFRENNVIDNTSEKISEALDILKLRYAKGEINTEEYLEIKRNLEGVKTEKKEKTLEKIEDKVEILQDVKEGEKNE